MTDAREGIEESAKTENTKGWRRLYLLVVLALVGQIAFYAWLTKVFS